MIGIKKIVLIGIPALLFAGNAITWNGSSVQAAAARSSVDVDLTILSSTMVYAEVFNMITESESYTGKTVRVHGKFAAYTDPEKSQYYPAVIIEDATACCAQGMEFILKGAPSYPDGYPEIDDDIVVVGTFETFEEEGMTFCRLADSTLE